MRGFPLRDILSLCVLGGGGGAQARVCPSPPPPSPPPPHFDGILTPKYVLFGDALLTCLGNFGAKWSPREEPISGPHYSDGVLQKWCLKRAPFLQKFGEAGPKGLPKSLRNRNPFWIRPGPADMCQMQNCAQFNDAEGSAQASPKGSVLGTTFYRR